MGQAIMHLKRDVELEECKTKLLIEDFKVYHMVAEMEEEEEAEAEAEVVVDEVGEGVTFRFDVLV